jgi:hypothetical protein
VDRVTNPHGPGRDEADVDPRTAPTAYVTAMFAVVFVIVLLGLQAYFGRVVSEEERTKVVETRSKPLADVRAEQRARLAEYRWVAKDTGVLAVPIERAMDLVAAELAARAPAPAASPAPASAPPRGD